MHKKINYKSTYVQIALFLFLLLLIALIPLLLIGRYAHPCADDFSYGYYTHAFWSTTHSLSETLHWALYQVKATYDTWQGTFSSVFLMSLSPAIWGEGYYFFTPIIMLIMIIVPHFILLHILLVKYIGVSQSIWCTISSAITFLMIETLVSPVNALFWYNGSVHYTFMHGIMILLYAITLKLYTENTVINEIFFYLLACILSVICGGSNYSTALLGLLGTIFISFFMLLYNSPRKWRNLFPIVVYFFAFYKNVTAYGNTIRQQNFSKTNPLIAIMESFQEFFRHAEDWMSLQILLFLILLIPFFWMVAETNKFSFRLPFVVSLLSICSTACMFTPSLYAMSSTGPDRLLNIVKLWFLFLLFLNEAYWIGYIKEKLPNIELKFDLRFYVLSILILVFLSFLLHTDTQLSDYSSYAAYVSLQTGEAKQFNEEYMCRQEILSKPDTLAILEPFSSKPRLLFFDDITTDKYDWRNMAVSRWYGKEYVVLAE